MFKRHLEPQLHAALKRTPALFLSGPRQCGKSTLAREVMRGRDGRYVTLDDPDELARAKRDPAGYLRSLGPKPCVIDEIQRAPELYLPLKADIDRDRRPGRFLLTGSTHVLFAAELADALVGRFQMRQMHPLSQGEIEAKKESLLDWVFSSPEVEPRLRAVDRDALLAKISVGGFPEMLSLRTAQDRRDWAKSYRDALLSRDIRDLANVDVLVELPRLFRLLVSRVGTLINYAELSTTLKMPQTTLKRYLHLMELAWLYQPLPAWSSNTGKGLARAGKAMLSDSGLAAHLSEALQDGGLRPEAMGALAENFVVQEIRKQASWSDDELVLGHFRTYQGKEVDLVIESTKGIAGIEVKTTSRPTDSDFDGLEALAAMEGKRFKAGVLLHFGQECRRRGGRLWSLPINALWEI